MSTHTHDGGRQIVPNASWTGGRRTTLMIIAAAALAAQLTWSSWSLWHVGRQALFSSADLVPALMIMAVALGLLAVGTALASSRVGWGRWAGIGAVVVGAMVNSNVEVSTTAAAGVISSQTLTGRVIGWAAAALFLAAALSPRHTSRRR